MKSNAAEVNSTSKSQFRVMPTASGHNMLLSAEEFPIYHLHITRFLTEFRPQDQWEAELVQRIADNHWRMDRIARQEMGLYARGRLEFASLYPEEDGNARSVLIEAQILLAYGRPLNNLSVQESRLRRYIEKDLAELRRLQAERTEREAEKKKPLTASAAASSTGHPVENQSENTNGFEFSNSLSTDLPRSQPELPAYANGKAAHR